MEGCNGVCELCQGRYCTKKVSFFSILTEEQLDEVTSLINLRKYKKGQMVFHEGDISNSLYLITKGKVKIFKYTKDGKEQILYILSDGDFIGDMSLLKKDEFKFNAQVLEETNIRILTKEDFDKLLKSNPDIALKIMEVIYDRVKTLEDSIQRLGIKDIEARLAGLLLSFIKDFGTPKGNLVVLDIPLSREDMANYIGATRETVSRKLSAMQDGGVIELVGNKKIIIRNIRELEAME